ncbi:hypothetical protein [Prosthecobacter dejongeii]|uniref:TIGR02611 family protein n=1 Tax=Prosthecobacter dejongeii TaxID=48465 RepID=A0A7W8DNR5_9BACT|nr:hypothetical protein [Prosthecobacter dejongeii]MBB5036829.1 hypothetical protein [Prosthecobacter dejongeii]
MSISSLWQDFKKSQPGERFEDFYRQRQADRSSSFPWKRILYVFLGIILSMGGVVLLGMPGPGLLVIALGLALVAGESLTLAKGMDKLELQLRKKSQQFKEWWTRLQPLQRGLGIAACAALLVALAGCAYSLWL